MKIKNDKIFPAKIFGVGDFGCKVIDYLADNRYRNIECIAINTDVQSLLNSQAHKRIAIGDQLTHGHGTSGDCDLGQRAAEASEDVLRESIKDSEIIFLAAGLGGGTGTGALSSLAKFAREAGVLTIGTVTLPFSFEGNTRIKLAESRLPELKKQIHTLIAVPGDQLTKQVGNALSLDDAFTVFADTFFKNILSIFRLINVPGVINLDIADIRAVSSDGPDALMAVGQASSQDRAKIAAEEAMKNVLGRLNLSQAKSVLFNVTGSPDLSLFEVNQVASTIRNNCSPNVNLFFGAITRPAREDLEVTILATGVKQDPAPKHSTTDVIPSLINIHASRQETIATPQLKVFLCHSSSDKPIVRKLYQQLYSRKGIDPWLDEAKLLPGVRWDHEIAKAVKESDVVIVCISKDSVNKEGYVQKEIKRALDIADEKPEEMIFIIPLKVEDCKVPERLSQWQWVNYYEDGAFDRLLSSLQKRAQSLGIKVE